MVAQMLRVSLAFGFLLLSNLGPSTVSAQEGPNAANVESSLEPSTTVVPSEETTTTILDKGPYWKVAGDCKIDPSDDQCVESHRNASTETSQALACNMTLLQERFLIGNMTTGSVIWVPDIWMETYESEPQDLPFEYYGFDQLLNMYQSPNTKIFWSESNSSKNNGWRLCANRTGHRIVDAAEVNSSSGSLVVIVVAVLVAAALCSLCLAACCICVRRRCCWNSRRDAKLQEPEKQVASNDSEVSDASERC